MKLLKLDHGLHAIWQRFDKAEHRPVPLVGLHEDVNRRLVLAQLDVVDVFLFRLARHGVDLEFGGLIALLRAGGDIGNYSPDPSFKRRLLRAEGALAD